MNWGSTKPADAIAPIGEECRFGQCSDFNADTSIYKGKGSFATDFEIQFKFEGTHETWVRNGLFEIVFKLLEPATEERKKRWIVKPNCSPVGKIDCGMFPCRC
jgi:hypothetical protein